MSLTDGRAFTAKLIGQDPQTDLAVIQISGSNLPVAQLGDSTQVQVGDWVVAIGNALALPGGPTVTAELVSATGRIIEEPPTGTSQIPGSGPYLFNLSDEERAAMRATAEANGFTFGGGSGPAAAGSGQLSLMAGQVVELLASRAGE